jgi:hypothetical protein
VLPSKAGKTKPVINRFYNRYHHTLCLWRKKEFAAKTKRTPIGEKVPEGSGAAGAGPVEGRRYSYRLRELDQGNLQDAGPQQPPQCAVVIECQRTASL